ncbi:MAG: HAD family hydrolase, partial [Acidimicrobiales bacterium]
GAPPGAAKPPASMTRVLYVDVDGTLVGPGGDLFWGDSTGVAEALLRARRAGLTVVPISGRGRLQVFELCRLLGLRRGIAELGCVHVDGREVRYELGRFPFSGRTPVEAMHERGAIALLASLGLESFDPWNEGREATYLLRGPVGAADANAALAAEGFDWCEVVDNGHALHLIPAGTGKAFGVRCDRAHHGLERADAAYVGDAASDLACAPEVAPGECWLVGNADARLVWPHRTTGHYGAGVAEVVDRLLDGVR